MKSLVSVIITNYNYEQYLSEAIDSVLNQTYQFFEIIVVDDGSSDNSVELIQQYEAQHPNKIKGIYKKNGGQASAFNRGYECAQGNIIAFLDADDYWYPDKLETVVQYHRTYQGIQHNLLINNEKKFVILEDGVTKQKKGLEIYGFMGTIPTSGLSFKKQVLEKVFPIPENEYRICADEYIKLMFLNYADILSLDSPKGCYRAHDSNQWFNTQASSIEYNKKTLSLLNEVRTKEKKKTIPSVSVVESMGRFMLNNIILSSDEKYVLYGLGKLADFFYQELNASVDIIYFSGSFVEEDSKFLDKEVKTLDYIFSHQDEYDKIIIASSQVNEILPYLISYGFKENQLIIPKL